MEKTWKTLYIGKPWLFMGCVFLGVWKGLKIPNCAGICKRNTDAFQVFLFQVTCGFNDQILRPFHQGDPWCTGKFPRRWWGTEDEQSWRNLSILGSWYLWEPEFRSGEPPKSRIRVGFGFRVSIGPGDGKSSESVSGFGFRSVLGKVSLQSRFRVSGFDRSWGR